MTNVKLINIYLDGFRASHYGKLTSCACPFPENTEMATHWLRGFDCGCKVDDVLDVALRKLITPSSSSVAQLN
ncbi:hypothetical protein [Thioflexithrix psekupsensis]|uniref:Uncharacterized protein n=1 Tax=Thioflexithrix psekupsensis TaxID=1570016 RepID=A0A251X9T6_9GAMM|nr:hypothetical protein [Thioflexithrix psekupsensis]OUD14975.1 hypothetical protein TPSD3_04525 [Thioflexithrix psekupsensis]